MNRISYIIICLLACAREQASEKLAPDAFDPAPLYSQYVERLPEFSEDGWIVSRKPDGQPQHQGDSLLWTGIAMAALPCHLGQTYSDRMIRMIEDNGGALVRFEPLGEYAGGREISFDGASGLYFGVLYRLLNCDDPIDDWAEIWQLHTDYLKRNYGYLHPNVKAAVEPEFTVLPDFISHLLGQRGRPHADRIRALEYEIAAWALAVKTSEEPCFRIHLGWLYLRSLERLNELSVRGKNNFCAATTKTDIPLIDHWCGRSHISEWDFVENEWEYRNQRCGAWETPDGKNLRTPGLDLLLAYSEVIDDR